MEGYETNRKTKQTGIPLCQKAVIYGEKFGKIKGEVLSD